MGKKDTVTKEYMSVPEHFADAFNFYLFDGKQLVRAEGLSQMDPVEIGIIFSDETKEIKDFSKFQTEFGKVMKYISVADREDGYKLIMNEKPYNEVTDETARLLNECVGLEFPAQKGDDNVKVCKAVEGIKAEGRLEGRLEGIQALIDTLRELNQSEEYIIDKIMDKFQLSIDEAEKYIK